MPDDGLFTPKHVAYLTLCCELCITVWKKKYDCKLITQRNVSPPNKLLLSLCNRRFISWHSGNLNTDESLNITTWKGVNIRHDVVSYGGGHEDYDIYYVIKRNTSVEIPTSSRGKKIPQLSEYTFIWEFLWDLSWNSEGQLVFH